MTDRDDMFKAIDLLEEKGQRASEIMGKAIRLMEEIVFEGRELSDHELTGINSMFEFIVECRVRSELTRQSIDLMNAVGLLVADNEEDKYISKRITSTYEKVDELLGVAEDLVEMTKTTLHLN